MKATSVSLFDLDGTLYMGRNCYLILDLIEFLADKRDDPDSIRAERDEYIGRYNAEEISRNDFAEGVLQVLYGRCFGGQAIEKLDAEIREFWAGLGSDMLFDFADELVAMMGKYTRIILVSGSPREAMAPIIRRLGLEESPNLVYASYGHCDDSVYSGKYEEFATDTAKEQLVEDLTFDKRTSFAFGDTDSDLPLLRGVDHGFAVVTDDCSKNKKKLKAFLQEAKRAGATPLRHDGKLLRTVQERVRVVFSGE